MWVVHNRRKRSMVVLWGNEVMKLEKFNGEMVVVGGRDG